MANNFKINGVYIKNPSRFKISNYKTSSLARLASGKMVGDQVEFGGLFGRAPIMRVSPYSAEAFIARGGRIPAPLQSLKN